MAPLQARTRETGISHRKILLAQEAAVKPPSHVFIILDRSAPVL
jgi:hypothetical protein